jgi:hypothetical protein
MVIILNDYRENYILPVKFLVNYFYILGNICFIDEYTMCICCIPNKKLAHPLKVLSVNLQDHVGESIVRILYCCLLQ